MRRGLPWLLSVPVMLAGSVTAHLVGRMTSPGEVSETGEVHAATALRLMPVVAAFLMLGAVVAAAWVWSKLRHREWRSTSARWFLIMPPVAYAAAEWGERLLHGAGAPIHEAQDANLALGLLLQLPFAGLAYGVARGLLYLGRALVDALRRPFAEPRRAHVLRPSLRVVSPLVVVHCTRSLAPFEGRRSSPPDRVRQRQALLCHI